MTPRAFDPDVVQSRLDLIAGLLDDLDGAGELSSSRLSSDNLLRHAIERILSQVVELAVAVNGHVAVTIGGVAPKDYRSSFALAAEVGLIDDALASRLRASVGLRNVLAHEYTTIDLDQVAAAARTAPADYGEYVRQASTWLRSRSA